MAKRIPVKQNHPAALPPGHGPAAGDISYDIRAGIIWDIPAEQNKPKAPPYKDRKTARGLEFLPITAADARGVNLLFENWKNPITSGDIWTLRAKRFADLVKAGVDPKEAAKAQSTSVEIIRRTREAVLSEVKDLVETYHQSVEARKLLAEVTPIKILLDNRDSEDPRKQELALKAARMIGEQKDVGIFDMKNGPVHSSSGPVISEGLAKLLEAVPLPTDEEKEPA